MFQQHRNGVSGVAASLLVAETRPITTSPEAFSGVERPEIDLSGITRDVVRQIQVMDPSAYKARFGVDRAECDTRHAAGGDPVCGARQGSSGAVLGAGG